MDDLRKDLRSLFERQQAGLREIRGSRETVIKRALARKDEPLGGRLNFAAGIAAVVIAALVVATFAYVRERAVGHEGPFPGASSSRVATPVVKPPSIPPLTAILDMDLVDLSTGWVLLTNCVQPMTGSCHFSVVATTDGGASWSKPVQVGGQFDPTNGDAPRKMHFTDKADGFVYGGAVAFITHDGGRTWAHLDTQAVFIGFITGRNGIVWAATYPCAKGTSCPYEVRSSADGGRTWSAPYKLPLGLSPGEAVPFAASGLLIATSTDLMMTLDGGSSWHAIRSACAASVFQEQVATSDGLELWLLCVDSTQVGPAQAKLYLSEDAGATWKPVVISQPGEVKPGINGVNAIVSLAAGSLLFNPGVVGVVVSHDRGVTWAKAGPEIGLVDIRFCSASDGWALDAQGYIWATDDGGDHWTSSAAVTITSS